MSINTFQVMFQPLAKNCTLAVFTLLTLASGLQASPFAYVVSASNQFGTINLTSGTFTSIGNTDRTLNSLTLSPGGILYSQDGSGTLLTLNATTAQVTPIGTGLPLAVNFRSDGALFGESGTTLYSVNSSTGATTPVGDFGTNFIGDAAVFSSTSQLYMVAATAATTSGLYTVNTTTGAATLIGDNGFLVFSIFFSGNTLYGFTADPNTGFGPGPIVTLNTATGAGTVVGPQDAALATVLGAVPFSGTTAAPEPATFALAGIATAFLFVARKRRA